MFSLFQKSILPAGPLREAAQRDLEGALAEEEQTLRHLLHQVEWPLGLAFTQQLGVLGDPVPTVTQVMVRRQSTGTRLITLMGTHFAPRAELLIDGRPGGSESEYPTATGRGPQQLSVVSWRTRSWCPQS